MRGRLKNTFALGSSSNILLAHNSQQCRNCVAEQQDIQETDVKLSTYITIFLEVCSDEYRGKVYNTEDHNDQQANDKRGDSHVKSLSSQSLSSFIVFCIITALRLTNNERERSKITFWPNNSINNLI